MQRESIACLQSPKENDQLSKPSQVCSTTMGSIILEARGHFQIDARSPELPSPQDWHQSPSPALYNFLWSSSARVDIISKHRLLAFPHNPAAVTVWSGLPTSNVTLKAPESVVTL